MAHVLAAVWLRSLYVDLSCDQELVCGGGRRHRTVEAGEKAPLASRLHAPLASSPTSRCPPSLASSAPGDGRDDRPPVIPLSTTIIATLAI